MQKMMGTFLSVLVPLGTGDEGHDTVLIPL